MPYDSFNEDAKKLSGWIKGVGIIIASAVLFSIGVWMWGKLDNDVSVKPEEQFQEGIYCIFGDERFPVYATPNTFKDALIRSPESLHSAYSIKVSKLKPCPKPG